MSNGPKEVVDLIPQPHLAISGHEETVYGIVYLPGGGRLVTCSSDDAVRIWDLENGEQEGMAMQHGGNADWAQGLAVTRDGKRILSGGGDTVLRLWDVETHQSIAEWGGHERAIHCIAISPDDQLVGSGDGAGRIVIREMKGDGQMKHVIETVPGDVNSIRFSPDGTKLASGHDDKMIRVFDVENGDLILGPIQGHTEHVYSVIWSLDGSRLFTASWDHSIQLWDSETGEAIGDPWTGHTAFINSLSLSPDGKKLASASSDETVRFWDTESGDPIGEPLQHTNNLWAVTFSPSGEFIACGGRSGRIFVWRVPWWVDSETGHSSLLDLPAVTLPSHTARDPDRQFGYLDLPTNRCPSPSRTRLRDTHATEDVSRTQGPVLSWRLWRTLPRLLFGRSHGSPRHAELTTIYPGFATQRIYVASMDDEITTERPTEPMPTAPGHYPGFSIMVESVSSTDSIHENQPTPAPVDNSEDVQVSCCALLPRRRGRSGTASALPAMPLTERVAPTSNSPAPAVITTPHPTAQNVLDLPAIAVPLSDTP